MTRCAASALLLVVLAIGACPGPTITLSVRVQTGLRAEDELRHVRATIAPGHVACDGLEGARGQGRALARGDQRALVQGNLAVAEFSGLAPGVYTLRVQGRRPGPTTADSGVILVERCVVTALDADRVLRVPLSAACLGATCPAPGGDPGFTECLGGRCVDPRCDPDAPEHAALCCDRGLLGALCDDAPTLCRTRDDCGGGPSCAGEAECVRQVCVTPEDDACDESEYCDTLAATCLPTSGAATDAGRPDAGHPMDTGAADTGTPSLDAAPDLDALEALDARLDEDTGVGMDAAGADARTMPDAPAPDAPPDARLDAGRDTNVRCGRTVLWVDGAGYDSLYRVEASPAGVIVSASLSSAGALPSLGAGARTFMVDDDDALVWQRPGQVTGLALEDTSLLLVGQWDVVRADLLTGSTIATVASLSPPLSSAIAVGIATDGAGGFVLARDASGPVTWNGVDLGNPAGHLLLVRADVSGVPRRVWTIGDAPSDYAWDATRVGSEVAVVGSAGDTFCEVPGSCVARAAGPFAVRLAATGPGRFDDLDGPEDHVTSDGARNLYATGRVGGSGRLSSSTPAGARRWSVTVPSRSDVAFDATRGRVWIAGRMTAPLVYPTETITLIDGGPTFAVLAFDPATGALIESHRFPASATASADIAVTPGGVVVVVGHTEAMFDPCDAVPVSWPASGSAVFVLRLRP